MVRKCIVDLRASLACAEKRVASMHVFGAYIDGQTRIIKTQIDVYLNYRAGKFQVLRQNLYFESNPRLVISVVLA